MTGNTVIAKFTEPDDTMINISDAPFQMFFHHISQIWEAFFSFRMEMEEIIVFPYRGIFLWHWTSHCL